MRNYVRSGMIALSLGVSFTSFAFAQSAAPQSGVVSMAPGETALAFLTRIAATDPAAVSAQAVALFSENKGNLAALVFLATNNQGSPVSVGVVDALAKIASDPTLALELSKQVSAMNSAAGTSATSLIEAAKVVASDAFSAAVGDGLADAASKAKAANNQAAVSAITAALSGADVPTGVKAAFDVGFSATAAAPAQATQNIGAQVGTGAAGGQAAAIGGPGAGSSTGGGTGGSQSGSTTTASSGTGQSSSSSAPSGGSSVSTGAGQTVAQADPSPTNP